uniref:Nucleosome assembly protein n=1 Tax=Kalanchoe fedtschenkoi TaxID=63787 RepID=A0A7N0TVX5_KALFE
MSQNDVTAVSQEEEAELVQALKDKLLTIERDPEKVIESLTPNVRKRIEKLQEIQKKHDDLEEKFIEEREALEAKYEKLYEPLYSERSDIVNGVVEVEGVTAAVTDKQEEKGVPEFWLTVLKANAVLAEEITKRDEGALKYLKDIKWFQIEDPKGFKLEFFFDTNPFFKNAVLTKTYHVVEVDEPVIEKAIGTEIEWYPGKELTKKLIQRKPKKGAKDDKPVTKLKDCDSFFNFFNPPQIPEDVENIDEEAAEDLQIQIEQDYDIGSTIRDDIIPNAVSWFTGEVGNEDEDVVLVDTQDEETDEDVEDENDDENEESVEN